MTMRATYVRLFADEHGESHFEDVTTKLDAKDFAPPAAALYVGLLSEAKSVFVVGVPPDWKGDAPHPSPKRQIFATVKGSYEVQASDGTVRQFGVGSILWLDDTTGKGHMTRMTTDGDTLIVGIEL